MTAPDKPILLDTHVWIWLTFGTPGALKPSTLKHFAAADRSRPLYVSIISVWEVSLLAAKRRLNLYMPTQQWVERALAHPALRLIELDDLATVIHSNELPGEFHPDPADRLLVASARIGGYTFATRDQKILAYGKSGHVNVLPA